MSIILRRKTKQIASAISQKFQLSNQLKSTQCHYRHTQHIHVRCLSQKPHSIWLNRNYSTSTGTDPLASALLDLVIYESVCSDTLEGLCEYFDDLVESTPHLKSADVNYSVRIFFL